MIVQNHFEDFNAFFCYTILVFHKDSLLVNAS